MDSQSTQRRKITAGLWSLFICNVVWCEEAGRREFFETRIRPALVEHCYRCHNSAKLAEGGLALDSRDSIRKGGENGPAVVAGNPEKSRLLAVLRHEIDGQAMPRDGGKFDAATIADFAKWIADGAFDPRDRAPTVDQLLTATSWQATFEARKKSWCFTPIASVQPPAASSAGDSTPIDRFIDARLAKAGLPAAARAADFTLARRLYFALLGLPPTPTELQQAATDARTPDGFSRLVDRLLADRRFGERWARHWMDWIRFAESHGSEGDPDIVGAWRYRDYLIRAINADVPLDQMLHEHIAGDLLAKPRVNKELGVNESALGPAHWRMVFHGYSPIDPLEEKVRSIDDQINAFSKAFLGLTVSCARCHDHKFDAIGQDDYFALYSILASSRPSRTVVDLPLADEKTVDQLLQSKASIQSLLAKSWLQGVEATVANAVGRNSFIDRTKKPDHPFHALRDLLATNKSSKEFATAWAEVARQWQSDRKLRDSLANGRWITRWNATDKIESDKWSRVGDGLARQPAPAGDFAIAPVGPKVLTGIYTSGTYSHLISDKSAARITSPDFRLEADSELWLRVLGDGGSTARFVARDYPRDGVIFPVARLAPRWQWRRFDLTYWTSEEIHMELATAADAPLMAQETDRSWFGVRDAILAKKGMFKPPREHFEPLDAIFLAAAKAPPQDARTLRLLVAQVTRTALLAWRSQSASDEQANLLAACLTAEALENRADQLGAVQPALIHHRKIESEMKTPTRVPGLEDVPSREHFVFARGNHKKPITKARPRFLRAIDDAPYTGHKPARLQLAESLTSDGNPLTRRVLANRIWTHLFGRGVVATPDNFGKLGEQPDHPALLDFLAADLKRNGWSLKKSIRTMVLSQCWQRASTPPARAKELDPENRLCSHARLRRLDAEAIRDSLFVIAGSLDGRMFGASVTGDAPRRAIYLKVQRNALDPFLRSFDFPEPFTTVGQRESTNVPAQALTLLNDSMVARLADEWARKLTNNAALQTKEQRIEYAYLAAFGRPVSVGELAAAQEFLGAVQESKAWSELARALFLGKEFLYLQ